MGARFTGWKQRLAGDGRPRLDVPSGNCAREQPAQLYRLETRRGQFLKWGVSQNPRTRYPAWFMRGKRLVVMKQGPRREMLRIERGLVELLPGPMNREAWRGKKK